MRLTKAINDINNGLHSVFLMFISKSLISWRCHYKNSTCGLILQVANWFIGLVGAFQNFKAV